MAGRRNRHQQRREEAGRKVKRQSRDDGVEHWVLRGNIFEKYLRGQFPLVTRLY